MYFGSLVKLSNNVNALRTDSVFGRFSRIPTVGESFLMFSESLSGEPNSLRTIQTSKIVRIVEESLKSKYIIFETQNSTYILEGISD